MEVLSFLVGVSVCLAGVIGVLIGLFENSFNRSDAIMYLVVSALVLYTGVYTVHDLIMDKEYAHVAEESAWVAKGCPVYKTQCGSKHPYACERKAAVIGRNRVGDTFVEAYGSCVSK